MLRQGSPILLTAPGHILAIRFTSLVLLSAKMSFSRNFVDEKGPAPHAYDETPIARGVRTNSAERNRKGSVVASLKAGYGIADEDVVSVREGFDLTHRKLKARHIQLIGIGGTIGTALYVQIGRGLLNGGPGSLFLAFTIW